MQFSFKVRALSAAVAVSVVGVTTGVALAAGGSHARQSAIATGRTTQAVTRPEPSRVAPRLVKSFSIFDRKETERARRTDQRHARNDMAGLGLMPAAVASMLSDGQTGYNLDLAASVPISYGSFTGWLVPGSDGACIVQSLPAMEPNGNHIGTVCNSTAEVLTTGLTGASAQGSQPGTPGTVESDFGMVPNGSTVSVGHSDGSKQSLSVLDNFYFVTGTNISNVVLTLPNGTTQSVG